MNFSEIPKNIIISSRKDNLSQRVNKYRLKNDLEDPNMRFSEKDTQINMKLINKIDFKTLFDKNNDIFLKKVLNNLISAKYYKSDYDDEYKPLLFISFQNSLDYLISKKNRLIKINNGLNESLKNINKQSNKIEKQLEENKKIIEEKSKLKSEYKLKYEELKRKYEEMKEKKEKIEINNSKVNIEKNININFIKKEEEGDILENENKEQKTNKKYYCKVCSNKFFLSQESLEDHQIRRHPFLIIRKSPEKKENMIDKKYSEKIESMKKYLKGSYNDYQKKEKMNESLEEIIKIREENNVNFENSLKNQEKNLEEIKSELENLTERQYKFINEFTNITSRKKSKKEIKEEKMRQKEYQKKLERAVKESLLSDKSIQDLKNKINELTVQLNDYCMFLNKKSNINLEDDEKQKKEKNLSIIDEFPISHIKEENIDYGDKTEKIVEAIIDSSLKNYNEEENPKIIEKNKQKKEKEEENIKDEKQKNINKKGSDEENEEGEEKNKEEEKKKEEEEKEEEEEEEEEEKDISILSKEKNEPPLEIDRIRNILNVRSEGDKNEISNFIDNVFAENKINSAYKEYKSNDKNSFVISKKSNLQSDIKLRNEEIEKRSKNIENIYYEIPIHSNKKFNIFQSEIDEIINKK